MFPDALIVRAELGMADVAELTEGAEEVSGLCANDVLAEAAVKRGMMF